MYVDELTVGVEACNFNYIGEFERDIGDFRTYIGGSTHFIGESADISAKMKINGGLGAFQRMLDV
ncbi:hypothetical protein JNUCC1_02760 [Lentibacillus sp. JNUCC-1]|nr:hypothetical protein [Lentibacillus sp. JNUCC-1]